MEDNYNSNYLKNDCKLNRGGLDEYKLFEFKLS